jgi:ABC-type lipoprotein release transport system permease subunit
LGFEMAIISYSWRNLWRNKKRTLITLAAVGLNTAILIATYALMDGFIESAVGNVTNMVVGEAQVHAPEYLDDHSLYKSLADPHKVLQAAKANNIGAAPRSYGYGLLSHGTKSAGALFWGVEPAAERAVFDLAKHVQKGSFLADKPRRGIVLGKKLAHSLNVKTGSEVVLVVQAADGSLGNDLYSVTGILKSAGDGLDRSAAIINIEDMRELFVLGDRVHEIALNSGGTIPPKELAAVVGNGDVEVKTWREILPMFSDLINLSDISIGIFAAIFFLAAGLGVMNTMLMATYERIHEFGVIKALGGSPWRIVRDVAAESLIMAVFATVLGTVIGIAGSYYLQVVGLDTSSFGTGEISIAGIAYNPIWKAALSVDTVTEPVIIMWIICLIASLYPAIVAARLDPVQAMQHV